MNDAQFSQLSLVPPRIIRACVTPMFGGEIKARPLVMLTKPEVNDPECEIKVCAGSRDAPTSMNVPFSIMVPGKAKGAFHPLTGLTDETWFYAGWIRVVKLKDIVEIHRHFPSYNYPKLLAMIDAFEKMYPVWK